MMGEGTQKRAAKALWRIVKENGGDAATIAKAGGAEQLVKLLRDGSQIMFLRLHKPVEHHAACRNNRAAAGVAQGLTVSEWACVRVCSRVCVRCRGCHRRREGDCGGHRWREPGHRCAAAVQQPQPRRAACLLGTAQPRSEKRYALWCGLGTHVCMC